MLSSRDHRRARRKKLLVRTEVFKNSDKGGTGRGFITNISRTGLRMETNLPLSPSAMVHIKFRDTALPGVKGKIVWTRALMADFFAYGIRFSGRPEDIKINEITYLKAEEPVPLNKESRISKRRKVLQRIEVIKDLANEGLGKGFVTNASGTGLRVETNVPLDPTKKVYLRFKKNTRPSIPARIVWARTLMSDFFAYGIKFLVTPSEFKPQLVSYVMQYG